ncbi:pyridoxamine 5'-phosphate oxidase family protein [Bradyrhizobium sp. LHD-71]|uniref:pyridoxamine 5'-phosphate oxidase family protein n=1 Tax=Bradyrhizobium sp. LHD-71 TaxID=3072141 RepID=UPI00280D0926|nr:pyridoxamine 5'-phosphate oxidase family protein [Bradyrhizobium sp. LHD-71]MDQ8729948.1 pyridoxamine 5'-phosphate oxidase family protein [Bradyrhizobium sp. LHD-71]
MNERIETTRRMLEALSQSDEAAMRPLLTETPAFTALGVNLSGVDSVLDRIARQPTREMYRQAAWTTPELIADGTRATGQLPKDAPRAGVVLTFRFDGERISAVQHQHLPPRPAPSTALRLTPKLKDLVDNALATRHPMLIAYTDERGQPVLSFRGSVQAFGDDQLALWVRNTQGQMLRSIRANPRVALMYRNEDSKSTYQFQGRARITTDNAERLRIYNASPAVEQAHDFAQLGTAVIIDLDRVEGYAGLSRAGQIDRVLMVRER